MKNKIYFLFIINLLYVNNVISQNNFEVIYEIKPTFGSIEKDQKIIKDGMQNAFKGVDEEFKNFEFELLINNKNSQFKCIEKLTNNKMANTIVKGISDNSNFYLVDSKTIAQKSLSSKIFYVSVNNESEWTTTNESKIIGDYLCYKATKIKQLIDGRKITVIAWFTNKIPLSFGPKEFNGLPGLIIELTDDRVTYVVKKVLFDSKKTFEFKLGKNKILSEAEFYEISKDYFEKSKYILSNE